MTDKVQKIREKVEKLMYGFNLEADIASCEDAETEKLADIKYQLCKKILDYTDEVQEEPVSIDFEQELYKAFGQVKDFTLGMRIAKWFYDMGKKSREPVSEELEEAVNAYIGYAPEVDECSSTYGKRQAFKAGAEWQKAKDESITNDLGEYINELSKQFPEVSFAKLSRIAVRVAQWQKEKMMAKAIDGDITFDYYGDDDRTYGCIAHDSFCLEDLGLKDTDKVKMIIIKED